MRLISFAPIGVALALAGCAAQATQEPDDPVIFGRADCRTVNGNAILEQEGELHRQSCMNQANAAATAGTANMPGGYGMGGAIAAGINQGITAGNINRSTALACMAEKGYIQRRRSEQQAACAAIAEQIAAEERQRASLLPKAKRKSLTPRAAPPA